MRILMLTWEFPPSSAGGIAAHVDGLSQAMSRLGHEVVVITRQLPGTPTDTRVGSVRVLRADIDLPWLPDNPVTQAASANHAFVAISARLIAWRPHIVHAHDWHVAWAANALSEIHGATMITTFHGTERGRHGGHLPPGDASDINTVEWWQSYRSSRVTASTKLMAREIVEGFELDPDRVIRVPAGIDPTWWQTVGPDEAADERSRRVFAWGRVQYEKGFQVLARAIATLRARSPGVECTIAGRGSYLPELQSQIDIAGVGDIIEVPGYLSDPELRAAVHGAGCVVIPSLYEPFGVVALEALAGGAPLVVANTGGLAEMVAGTGAALLFEPGNADDLASCIERVLNERELGDEMIAAGKSLLVASYSWDAIAARTLDVFNAALQAS
jgi:glycogen(starch) synthase